MRGRNRLVADRVEAWEWHAPDPIPAIGEKPSNEHEAVQGPPQFDLDTHWLRGGYRASLFAADDAASAQFLDNLIATDLVVLPSETVNELPIDGAEFLRKLALYNGCELETLRRKLQWDRQSFDDVIQQLTDAEFIFHLPFLPGGNRTDIYYFCDTGVLHRLFNPRWGLAGKGRNKFAKSWEGFVVRTIWKRFGRGAQVFVWRQSDREEIDLVLRWSDRTECWAIEIGLGEDKRPSIGFWTGVEELGATDLFIVHRGNYDLICECERLTLAQMLSRKTD